MDLKEFVKIHCPKCGESKTVEKYCPFTGHMHGNGWTYTCQNCGQPMEVEDASLE